MLGLDKARNLRELAGAVPVVAIGGITEEQLPPLYQAGFNCYALIARVGDADCPLTILNQLKKLEKELLLPQNTPDCAEAILNEKSALKSVGGNRYSLYRIMWWRDSLERSPLPSAESGGIGRRARFRSVCGGNPMEVQVLSSAPAFDFPVIIILFNRCDYFKNLMKMGFFVFSP